MKTRILAAGATALILAVGVAGCAGGKEGNSSDNEGVTLSYWASNQGASLQNDAEVLQPELDKFEEQTGIKVDLEVVSWGDLTNSTLSAAVSGQGPDVLNIGNTNAVTFQSTGAFYGFDDAGFDAIGGKDRFVETALATGGAEGEDPTSIPLYSQVYGLYYNKQMFADKGVEPPTTWEELVSAAEAFTDPAAGKYGIVIPGGTVNASMHFSYIFAAQNGASPFDKDGNPDFTSDGMVAGVKQYVDLLSEYHVVNPSAAQYTESTQSAGEFARGEVAMYMAQTSSGNVLAENGMDAEAYGVVPIPAPEDGEQVSSFVAGTNISIFKDTEHLDAALEFVKFLTSDEEQEILNKAYTSLPVVNDVPADAFADDPDKFETWSGILADNSIPMALVPTVQAYQANVGGAVVGLVAKAATGAAITEEDVKTALQEAQDKMGATG